MALLSREDLMTLAERRPGWHVSLFLPMQRAGVETLQNSVRCKNALRQAAESLLAGGLRPSQAQELLEPVQQLLGDYNFWQHQRDGLAVFVGPGIYRIYCLPCAFDELVVVNQRFHIKPLLPLLSDEQQFYILALSQNQVRLFECTRYRAMEVDLPHVPQGLDEALKYDEVERHLQFHTRTQTFDAPSTGERAAIFHGHDEGSDDAKDRITEYFRQIDRSLAEVLKQTSAPLVLAGVEYLLPLYKEITAYGHITATGITGNPEGLRAEELQERAQPIVAPLLSKNKADAAARYQRYRGTGLASHDLREVLLAAHYGRVATLFVATNVQQWGTFDPETQKVQVASEPAPECEDLLDYAAQQTLLNSGTVYAVPPEQMPEEGPLAAVLRY